MVELSGEANPLNRQTLFNALAAAAGTTQQQVQTGAQQLQNWEKADGYYSLLQVRNEFFVIKALLTACTGHFRRLFPPHRSSLSLDPPIEERHR